MCTKRYSQVNIGDFAQAEHHLRLRQRGLHGTPRPRAHRCPLFASRHTYPCTPLRLRPQRFACKLKPVMGQFGTSAAYCHTCAVRGCCVHCACAPATYTVNRGRPDCTRGGIAVALRSCTARSGCKSITPAGRTQSGRYTACHNELPVDRESDTGEGALKLQSSQQPSVSVWCS